MPSMEVPMARFGTAPDAECDVTFTDPEGERPEVTVFVFAQADGATVIQIDTTQSSMPRIRVNVNDGTVYDRDTETDQNYGDDLH